MFIYICLIPCPESLIMSSKSKDQVDLANDGTFSESCLTSMTGNAMHLPSVGLSMLVSKLCIKQNSKWYLRAQHVRVAFNNLRWKLEIKMMGSMVSAVLLDMLFSLPYQIWEKDWTQDFPKPSKQFPIWTMACWRQFAARPCCAEQLLGQGAWHKRGLAQTGQGKVQEFDKVEPEISTCGWLSSCFGLHQSVTLERLSIRILLISGFKM